MRAALPSVLLFVAACPPPAGTTTDGDQPSTTSSSTSTTTGSTMSDQPTTSVGPESTVSTSPTSPTPPDLPPPCPVGSVGCPCTGGGACDPGNACEAGTCVDGCAVGSPGCPCTLGGGCDPGSTCVNGTCGEAVSPPCDPDVLDDDCCGDGVVDALEECDMSMLNKPNGECTPECKLPVCGDGFVLDPIEACDGGDDCTAECKFTTCGDGIVDEWEWCEQERPDDQECTPLCTDARKVVFITSEHYQGGMLGGIEGADAKCQSHADSAGLPGSFRAWLGSSPDDSPLWSFDWKNLPYVNVDGDFLFMPLDLPCGGPGPLLIDETGAPHSGCDTEFAETPFWLWLMYDGGSTCGAWDDISDTGSAFTYLTKCTNGGISCSRSAPIVCVER